MKQKKKKIFRTKTRTYAFLRTWLDIEYKCFGYRTAGGETDEDFEGLTAERDFDGNLTGFSPRITITNYAYYVRPVHYPKTLLFILVSFINAIVSRIRVFFSNLLPFSVILLVLITFFGTDPEFDERLLEDIVGLYGLVYLTSIALNLLGFLIRKIARLDKRMDKKWAKLGYKPWSEYPNR